MALSFNTCHFENVEQTFSIMKIKASSVSPHTFSHSSSAVLRLSFASPSEVKKSGGDLCRCMRRNSSRPYDVVLLLQNTSSSSQREWVCVCARRDSICVRFLLLFCIHLWRLLCVGFHFDIVNLSNVLCLVVCVWEETFETYFIHLICWLK